MKHKVPWRVFHLWKSNPHSRTSPVIIFSNKLKILMSESQIYLKLKVQIPYIYIPYMVYNHTCSFGQGKIVSMFYNQWITKIHLNSNTVLVTNRNTIQRFGFFFQLHRNAWTCLPSYSLHLRVSSFFSILNIKIFNWAFFCALESDLSLRWKFQVMEITAGWEKRIP